MSASLIEEGYTDEGQSELVRRLDVRSTTFADLVRELDLDPKRDFRHADLAGVDFSGADLSSFDFTGADLRGTFGVGVRTDGAVLEDANLAGSLFEYARHRRDYFAERPEAAKVLKTLSRDHWTRVANWVADHVRKKRSADALEIANALFLDTDDLFLKNQILFFVGPAFEDRDSYLAFLLATLNAHGDDWKIRGSVINVLASIFGDHRVAFEILKREVPLAEGMVQNRILLALARSRHARTNFAELRDHVKAYAILPNRRTFVRASIEARGHRFSPLLRDPTFARRLDFGAAIPEQFVLEEARAGLLAEWLAEYGGTSITAVENLTDKDVHRRYLRLRELLQELDEAGYDMVVRPQPVIR